MSDFILFCDPLSFSLPRRGPPLTYRLALPSSFSDHFMFYEKIIWIVVVVSKEAFLHAKLFVDYEELLERLETSEKYLYLEGSISESKYVTAPDNLMGKKANVTKIISGHFPGFHLQSFPRVSECPEDLSTKLVSFVSSIERTYLSVSAVPKAIVSDLMKGFNYAEFRYKTNKFDSLLRNCFLKAKRKIPIIESFTTREMEFPFASLSLIMANEVEKKFMGKAGEDNLQKAIKVFSSLAEEGTGPTEIAADEESFFPPALEELEPKNISFRVSLSKVCKKKKLSKIRSERAERHHQEILKHLAEFLKQRGFSIFFNIKIDLAIAQDNSLTIFEIKSTTKKNYIDQARNAVVQLLENEFFYSSSYDTTKKIAVFEHMPSKRNEAFLDGFLEFTGIKKIYYDRAKHAFVNLDDLINKKYITP